ncbi:MAG: CDP-glycerol glycerophosphotransferase family protein [Candidatus Woesearchaeota archaeon]
MKKLNYFLDLIVSKFCYSSNFGKIDILFLGDYGNLLYQGEYINKYFLDIQQKLGNYKYRELLMPNPSKSIFKKIGKSQIPLEALLPFPNPKFIIENKNNKAINAFINHLEWSSWQKFAMLYLYQGALNILKKLQPKVIVLKNSYSPCYVFIMAAKNLGIPTIELQHGVINNTHPGYVIPKRLRGKYLLPNYIIVSSEYEKKILVEKSIFNKKQVKALGISRYDFLKHYKINKNDFRRKYGIAQSKKILFWPTQTHDRLMSQNKENELNAECVFSTLKEKKDWFLVIKFHPGENQYKSRKFYEFYAKKYKIKNYLILDSDNESTYDCIYVSDAVILKHSTVGLESLLMNRPILNFELKKSWDLSQFKNLDSCLIISKKDEFKNYLKLLDTSKYKKSFEAQRQKYIDMYFSNFGTATKENVRFIENVIQR